MQMATTLRRSTHTFLTHLFGPGLDDDRYVIERFQSKADGEIRPRRRNGASKKGRGKASREIANLSTVQRMRPERDEIIICTGVNCTTLEPFFLQSKELESLQHNLPHLQGVVEGHQPLVFLPRPDRPWFNYVADRHCLGLHLKVDFGVDVGGIDRGMAKPCADRIDIHASKDQVAGSCMSQHMRRYFSPFQRRHTRCAVLST